MECGVLVEPIYVSQKCRTRGSDEYKLRGLGPKMRDLELERMDLGIRT